MLTRDGDVRGVVVAASDDGEPRWSSLRVDIGAADREDALRLVRTGDPIVLDGAARARFTADASSRPRSTTGPASTPRSRRCGGSRRSPPRGTSSSSSRRRRRPARTGAPGRPRQALAPDVAVVVEVTYDADAPGPDPWGDVRLGGGPTVFRGAVVSPVVGDGLLAVAEQERIEVGLESGQTTASDADDIFTTGAGVPCGIVCIPLRYMHTAAEIVQLSDVEAASPARRGVRALARRRGLVPSVGRRPRRG